LYNNKRLKDIDFSEDIVMIRDYIAIYLKLALKESGKVKESSDKYESEVERSRIYVKDLIIIPERVS
jgi:hypothetical protein